MVSYIYIYDYIFASRLTNNRSTYS